MKYDLFISYSRKDFDEVSSILEIIKTAIPNLSYWFDIDGIESGDEFEDKIISAIDNSSYVLFALSENSIQSQWTKDEVMYAKNTDKKVIPILLKGAQMKGWFLFKFGRIDCIDSTNTLQIEKLLQNLSDWTGKDCVDFSAESVVERTSEQLCPCGSGKLFKDCHGRSAVAQDSPSPVTPKPVAPIVSNPVEHVWKVGDYYNVDGKEGVVFWVDETGKHGKIVSLDQAKLRWCTYREFNKQKQIGASSDWDGNVNLSAVKNEDAWAEKYPSFSWCSNHGAQWYLPAYKELFELFKTEVVERVNDTLGNYGLDRIQIDLSYWSSTEAESTRVFVIHHKRESSEFFWLDVCSSECFSVFSPRRFKHEMYNVRAVAAF